MRHHGHRLLALMLVFGLALSGCIEEEPSEDPEQNDRPTNEDVEAPLEDLDTLTEGAPDNEDLPEVARADETFPATFDLVDLQSPVSDQGRRGVCSIFSAVGLMEHLYIKADHVEQREFSEQYLQWSAKQEVGNFTNSSGSNSRTNLRAISNYGIVEEQDWEYEPSPWGPQDDEECQGDDRPTYCYTNGDPPQEALDAPKYKLPRGRWTSTRTRDLKAHMYNENEGVVVGGDFYYQAWNHSGSDLPTNQDYWREGYVLYPNERDQELSRENPAGHSILLVGWDDNLEVERVDENGDVILDEDGEPETEQGFFIFKNSWGTGSFGVDNEHGDGYGFISYDYVREFKTARVAGTPEPHHVPDDIDEPDCVSDADCDSGEICEAEECVIDDTATCAEHAECDGGEICDSGECVDHEPEDHTYLYQGDPQTVPDNDPEGLTTEIEVDNPGPIEDLQVDVYVEHTRNGFVEIDLIHPSGKTVTIYELDWLFGHDIFETFDVDEFDGLDAEGTWKLNVAVMYEHDDGTLHDWALHMRH